MGRVDLKVIFMTATNDLLTGQHQLNLHFPKRSAPRRDILAMANARIMNLLDRPQQQGHILVFLSRRSPYFDIKTGENSLKEVVISRASTRQLAVGRQERDQALPGV